MHPRSFAPLVQARRFGMTQRDENLSRGAAEALKPPWFADVFLIDLASAGSHDSGPSEVAHNPALVGAVDNWQAADVVAQHFFGRFVQSLIRIRDHHVARARVENRA
jgi:hypothetical protein